MEENTWDLGSSKDSLALQQIKVYKGKNRLSKLKTSVL